MVGVHGEAHVQTRAQDDAVSRGAPALVLQRVLCVGVVREVLVMTPEVGDEERAGGLIRKGKALTALCVRAVDAHRAVVLDDVDVELQDRGLVRAVLVGVVVVLIESLVVRQVDLGDLADGHGEVCQSDARDGAIAHDELAVVADGDVDHVIAVGVLGRDACGDGGRVACEVRLDVQAGVGPL